jgi:hypothetical protein
MFFDKHSFLFAWDSSTLGSLLTGNFFVACQFGLP